MRVQMHCLVPKRYLLRKNEGQGGAKQRVEPHRLRPKRATKACKIYYTRGTDEGEVQGSESQHASLARKKRKRSKTDEPARTSLDISPFPLSSSLFPTQVLRAYPSTLSSFLPPPLIPRRRVLLARPKSRLLQVPTKVPDASCFEGGGREGGWQRRCSFDVAAKRMEGFW